MENITNRLSVVLLCGGSLFCSILLFSGDQNQLYKVILAGCFATGLELAKFISFIASKKSENLYKKFIYSSLGWVLLAVSVFASVAFFESGSSQGADQQKRTSAEYLQKVQQLDFINKQIATIQQLVKKDADNNYRQRSYQQLERLNGLYDRTNILREEISEFKAPSVGVNSVFETLSNWFGYSIENVRLVAFIFLAALIDISGIACLLFATKKNVRTLTETKKQQQTESINGKTTKSNASNVTRAKEIAKKIINGDYGKNPVVRHVIDGEHVGHKVAKRVFDYLIENNKITQQGRTYELV